MSAPVWSLHLILVASSSLALMALGLWIGRRVRGASDFFVAGRRLGPGLIFSTMLAANIGAGSTVGATGLGYSHGVSASWGGGGFARPGSARSCWRSGLARRCAGSRRPISSTPSATTWSFDTAAASV